MASNDHSASRQFNLFQFSGNESLELFKTCWLISLLKDVFTMMFGLTIITMSIVAIILIVAASSASSFHAGTLIGIALSIALPGIGLSIVFLRGFRRESLAMSIYYVGIEILTIICLVVLIIISLAISTPEEPIVSFFWIIVAIWKSVIFGFMAFKYNALIRHRDVLREQGHRVHMEL